MARATYRNDEQEYKRAVCASCARGFFVVAALALAVPPVAALPPSRRWSTIRTACCDVTYHDGLEPVAPRFAAAAQEAHETMERFLGYQTDERTQLILSDDTDFANGSAIPIPYNRIHAYARPPSSFSDLGDYDDWARALILHEYTHIAHTDTIRGIPRLVNWLFGKVYPPNMLQPRWFVEGLAVFAETRLTSAGRAHSSLFDMYLRAAALDGRLWPLDLLSSATRPYPGGNAAYLYGGHFLQWLGERYGEQVFGEISRRYGGTLLPYAINWSVRKSLGEDFEPLYNEWQTELTRKALEVQRRVVAAGATPTRRLSAFGQSVLFPRALRDGRIAFYATPTDDTPGLYLMTPRKGDVPDVRRLVEVQSVQGLSPTPDGRAIVFAQPEVYANAYSWLDLFRLDLLSGELTRITNGARLRDPDVHPDGRAAIAVQHAVGASKLVLVDLQTGALRPVFSFDDGSEIHSPRFSANGSELVFSAWRPGGFRDVYLLRPGQAPRRLTHDRAMDMHPAFSDDGKSIVFSADRDGVFNIYRKELDSGREEQLTNVVTGAFMPVVLRGADALLFIGFHVDGYDLYAAPLWPRPPAPPPDEGPGQPLPVVVTSAPEPYNPLPSLIPRYWTPVVSAGLGGVQVGARVVGEDLVGYHSYAMDARVRLPRGEYAWSLAYRYGGIPTPLFLSATGYAAGGSYAALSDGVLVPYTEDVVRAEVGIALPLQRWRLRHEMSLAYSLELRRPRVAFDLRPDEPLPYRPIVGPTGSLVLGYSYSDVRSVRDSVSIERGRRLSSRVRVAHPYLISRFSFVEASADWREYIPVPALARHVWFLMVSGGFSRGDDNVRRAYFLGGPPPRDIFLDALFGGRLGSGYLRGYPFAKFIGDGFLLVTTEWRFPLVEVQHGLGLVPLFLDRVWGLVFLDQGLVFADAPRTGALRRGVGAELWIEGDVFYAVPLSLRLGLARGLDAGGEEMQFYMALGAGS